MGLQADYLQDVAEELVPLYAQLQTDILEDVARRIAKTGRITDTADWQMRKMREAGIVNRDATRRIARLSGETQRTIASVFDQACTKAIAADDAIYKAAGLKLTPISASQSFRQIMLAGVDKNQRFVPELHTHDRKLRRTDIYDRHGQGVYAGHERSFLV